MKQKDRLTSRLFIIATIAFYGALLFSGYIIFCDIFIKPTDSVMITPNHNYGYSVPVSLQLNKPGDSTLVYKSNYNRGSGQISTGKSYPDTWHNEFYRKFNDSTLDKTLTVDSLTIFNDHFNKINSEFSDIKIVNAEGFVVLNPKDYGLKILLSLKNYILLFVTIYVLWFTRSFFKKLNLQFSFNSASSRKLWVIGNAILSYQILNWILCIIIKQYYTRIVIDTFATNGHKSKLYTLYPETEFSLGLVLLALSLIVISKLFSLGYNLQQENDLTV
ncbi:DUF2975 domain-containing protein [Flavobacterium sp. DG1-102-2]|uniref:DUF2975 domain-containing protein n=1 Tax=Flavobacterium sp. DG1-102-2 TaxID=3081663 RepID=UPI0029493842|nr:DUF2975 domain-containing protein [Flavobacterium sp. DG1-102-2]MDV6167546.1 DUF2975 domain-containing protein [Flavobacterium sp. DG1-102-2]